MVAMPPASTAAIKSARLAKRKIAAGPKTEPLRVREILHARGAGRRDIDNARLRQRMLQAQSCAALLRRQLVAAITLLACGIRHGVRFVKENDAVEIFAEPIEYLVEARALAIAFG